MNTNMNQYQFFLPLITVLYLLVVFIIRSIIVWRQTGVNPFVFGSSDKAYDYLGFIYKMTVIGIASVILLYSFIPHLYEYLVPIRYLDILVLKQLGLSFLVISFLWTLVAQIQMANSWRIGINYEEKTELVQKGIFGISRNPVFLGVLVFYLGIFLITPNAISLALWLVMWVAIQVQIRLEEEFLGNVHGTTYKEYKSKVRRWV